jgi:riboflavin synthase
MFTGIIEEMGTVVSVAAGEGGARLVIAASNVLDDATVGASIAVNGCCLTVVDLDAGTWACDAVVETLSRTNLGDLRAGDTVNLERPLRLADRLDGHLVQGHVDATAVVEARTPQPDGSVLVRFAADPAVLRYVVEKGSIAVDGISLTTFAVDRHSFTVAVIPHTLAVTTLGTRAVGARVNVECDIVAKYVERLSLPTGPGST